MQRRPVQRLRALAARAQLVKALQALHLRFGSLLHRSQLHRVGTELRSNLAQLLRGHVHAQLLQPGYAARKLAQPPAIEVHLHGGAAHDLGQAAAHARLLRTGQQLLPQLALLLRLGVRQRLLQTAVGLDQAQRRLFAHAGHAGDVVRGVAHQTFDVNELFWFHAVGLPHVFRGHAAGVADALAGVEDGGVLPGELEGIPVAGDQQHLPPGLLAGLRDRAEDVVGLVAGALQNRNLHARDQLADDGILGAQVVRHGLAGGLVAVEDLLAEGGRVHVEGHGQAVGPLLADHLQQHHHKAVHRIRGRAVRRAHQRLQRMICAIHQAVTIQQHHLFHSGKLLLYHNPSLLYQNAA